MQKFSNREDRIQALERENAELRQKLVAIELMGTGDLKWSQSILDSIPNPLFIKNENHVYVLVNQAFSDFVKLPKSEFIGKTDFDFFPDEQSKIFWKKDSEVLKNGKTNWNEEVITVDNEKFELLTSKVLIRDKNSIPFVLGLVTDISNNKNQQVLLLKKKDEIEHQKQNIQILLKEVHHRVKNNLQIVSSLLNMQMSKFKDKDTQNAFLNCKNRILAMAEVHDVLCRAEKFTDINIEEYLGSLLENIRLSFKTVDKIKFNINVESLFLDIESVIPIGLLINEIVTNSVKHGYNAHDLLEIYINMSANDNCIVLEVGDNGIGLGIGFEEDYTKSLGMELIILFSEQLDAKLTRPNKEKGFHYKIVFDL